MTAPDVLHIPSKPVERGAATTGSQRDRRFTDTFYDIHRHSGRFPNGRPFTGEREFTSGAQTESITAGFITSDLQQGAYYCDRPEFGQSEAERRATLASTWTAPWLPISKYFRFNYRQKRISFAYEKLIADETEGLDRYWNAAAKMAGENDVIDPNRPNAVPFRIKTTLGTPGSYTDKIRLAQAAIAGDPWLLGFVDEPNVELAKLLRIKVNYIGGRSGDAEYTETQLPKAPTPLLTPEQVLESPDVQRLIAEAVAKAMEARDAQTAKKPLRKNAKKERAGAGV